MASPNRHRPFSPDPAQVALKPEISGNAINGVGETTPRRPRMVYWAQDPTRSRTARCSGGSIRSIPEIRI
jgi:hypothetical protein